MLATTHGSTETVHHRQITVSQSIEKDELLAYVVTEKPDLIAITETWNKPDYLISEFSIPGYESLHKSRAHKKGGGVICYIKTHSLP